MRPDLRVPVPLHQCPRTGTCPSHASLTFHAASAEMQSMEVPWPDQKMSVRNMKPHQFPKLILN